MDKNSAEPIRILLADDSPTIQKIIKVTFANQNATILSATDGNQALDILKKEQVDIILADIIMPEVGGYDLCAIIKSKENLKRIPVVLLARNSEDIDPWKIKQVGANAYLVKPIEPLELIALVKKLYAQEPFSFLADGKTDFIDAGEIQSEFQEPDVQEPVGEDATITPAESELEGVLDDEVVDHYRQDYSPVETITSQATPEINEDWSKLFGKYILHTAERIFRETLEKMVPGLTNDIVVRIEKIIREMVPELAEKIIREEIEKIKRGDSSD